MEGISKALQQPEYVHVVLNHLPITGLFVALVALVVAMCLKGPAPQMLALVLVALCSLSAWPVAHYGEAAFDRTLAMSDDAGGQYLRRHEALANRWIFLFYATTAGSVAGLVVGRKWPKHLRKASSVVALLAASSLVAGAIIAGDGGKIRHREFRYGPAPSTATETSN